MDQGKILHEELCSPPGKMNMMRLEIRGLEISPPLALAPMVGLSHSALRSLVLELGGVGLLFTEMLSAKRLPLENETVSPFLIRSSHEYPLFYQLFISDEKNLEPVVERLHILGAQGIDINLGCPAPKLRKQGAGCYLTRKPDRVQAIIKRLRKCSDLPLSVKIRLGDKLDRDRLLGFCGMLEGEGIDLITVHGRLNGEKFCRKPRWEWIGEVKKHLEIPVIANGGIFTVKDAEDCLRVTGADGLMLGRGAAWRPWLFKEIGQEIYGSVKSGPEISEREIYLRFIELLTERFSQERRLGRLKQFTHYFALTYPFGHHLASAVQTSSSMEQAQERALLFFSRYES